MVGPTAQHVDDKQELTTTAASTGRVFARCNACPRHQRRDCIAEFAGLRAADGEDFIIGPTAKRGFINVAGIQSPGLTAAPAIARMVAGILADEGLELTPKDGFIAKLPEPVRFAKLTTDEQKALTEVNPRYARIACRCELVTEGEVVDAIRQGQLARRHQIPRGRAWDTARAASARRCIGLLARTRPAHDGHHQARRRFLDPHRPRPERFRQPNPARTHGGEAMIGGKLNHLRSISM